MGVIVGIRVNPEDIAPLIGTFKMVDEELERGSQLGADVVVAAKRVVWQHSLREAVSILHEVKGASGATRPLLVEVSLSPAVSEWCGKACMVAASFLNHYAGYFSELVKGPVQALVASQIADPPTFELVERHFPWVRGDAAFARDEELRLRTWTHELLIHHADGAANDNPAREQ